ncbi:MAG: Stealth CR1 domain-containing protein [Bacteroidaceae bacterium]|nr:Stealth CR1 domain-containing protein [Bacteroidaceae bacterium]
MKIDVVIAWVDGSDPVLNAKRAVYAGNGVALKRDEIGGTTRYANMGEIYWCVRSINKFIPWVNKIYIVTDGQNPEVESEIPVEIVDHRTVFRGYEQYLPTFNSVTIETMLWRIPGLEEHFIYFNDDMFLCSPLQPTDFFLGENVAVLYGKPAVTWWTQLRYRIKPYIMHQERINPRQEMLNAVYMMGGSFRFPRIYHTPRPFLKSVYGEYYVEHPEALDRNLSCRFRDERSFRPDVVCYLLMQRSGGLRYVNPKGYLLEYNPGGGMKRLVRKMRMITGKGKCKFVNMNSLDKVTPEMFEYIKGIMEKILA